jgi:hypothetical protein
MLEQLIKHHAYVFSDLTEQDWGNIPALMKGNRCAAACVISELLVRTSLADFGKAEFDKNCDDLIGFEDGNIAHDSSDGYVLNPDKLRLKYGFAIFQKHCDDIVQVAVNLIQCFPLGMCSGKAGDKTNEQASLWAPLNYG